MNHREKLIEVALPLPEINDASAYDKMPWIGPHPKSVHHWWARLPLPMEAGRQVTLALDSPGLVVRPDVAARQFPEDERRAKAAGGEPGGDTVPPKPGETVVVKPPTPPQPPRPTRFHGSVKVDPTRLARDAGQIAQEVVQHLTGLVGAKVEISLEIQAHIPDGAPDQVVRTVTENCRTLKFTTHGFEQT